MPAEKHNVCRVLCSTEAAEVQHIGDEVTFRVQGMSDGGQ